MHLINKKTNQQMPFAGITCSCTWNASPISTRIRKQKKTMASGDATPSRQLFWTLVNLFQPLRSALSVWLSNYRRQRNGSSHVVIATNSRFTASDSCVGQISAKICAMTIVKVIAVGNCLTPAGRKTIYFVYEFRCIAFAHRKLFSWSL